MVSLENFDKTFNVDSNKAEDMNACTKINKSIYSSVLKSFDNTQYQQRYQKFGVP